MKQLIHSSTSCLPRLQPPELCQAFIIPSFRMELHNEVKLYIALHCGPDIIISLVCGLFNHECALDQTYWPLKKLFILFLGPGRSQGQPLSFVHP